jgi:hypothetical protein
VVGLRKYYKISNYGRIKCVKNFSYKVRVFDLNKRKLGWRTIFKKKELLTPFVNEGYFNIRLFTGKGVTKFKIHRLVLEAFKGPCPEGMMGLHKDDNPENNHIDNLYWGTRSQNRLDAYRNGKSIPLIRKNEDGPNAKLSWKKVKLIRTLWENSNIKQKTIAEKFDISPSLVSKVVRKRMWN